jgi:hypothetical protein
MLIISKKTVFELGVAPSTEFKDILMLNYYRNGLMHLFIIEAIFAATLCSFGVKMATSDGVPIEKYFEETQFLLSLLEKEHVSKISINNF